jgi:hypothetical protein
MTDNITTPDDIVWPQAIYARHEIPVADYLMSFREKLTEEFLAGFNSVKEASEARCIRTLGYDYQGYNGVKNQQNVEPIPLKTFDEEKNQFEDNLNSWKNLSLKYETRTPTWGDDAKFELEYADPALANQYPTALSLTRQYGEYCPISLYTVMGPRTVLHRHTGPENRSGKYIRIHIPLIIPEGDVFLEVNGEKVDWSDLVAFNNQLAHSSWNLTDGYRLNFMIDLDREFIGLSPGSVYDERLEKYAKPFNEKEYYLETMNNLQK